MTSKSSSLPSFGGIGWFWPSLASIWLFGAFLAGILGPHTADVTWLIQVGERLFAGEQLYIDVRESNPPFSVALYLPFVALQAWTGLSAHIWTSFGLFALLGLSLSLSNQLLRDGLNLPETERRLVLLALSAACLLPLPLQFAQREHFGIIAALPWFCLLAARTDTDFTPRLSTALLIGALASILAIIKPFYALGLGIPLLWQAWQRRSLKALFIPEALALAAMVLLYGIILVTAFPIYLNTLAPMLVDIYLPYRQSLTTLISTALWLVGIPFVATLIARRGNAAQPTLVTLLLLATAGFVVSYLLSGKGWLYHLWPALVCAFSALALQIISAPAADRRDLFSRIAMALGVLTLATVSFLDQRISYQPPAMPEVVKALAPQPRIAFFTTEIALSAPYAHELAAEWTEKDPHDYIAALALPQLDTASPERRARLEAYIQQHLEEKLDYLMEKPADLIMVDGLASHWVDHAFADPRIAAILNEYEEIAQAGSIRFLALKGRL